MKNIHKPTQSQKPGEPQPVDFLTREKCQAQRRPDPSTSSYWKRCKPIPFSPQTAIWRQISFSTHVGKAKRFVYICQKATVKTTLQYGQYLGVCLGKKQIGSFPCLATPSTRKCRPGMALSPPHYVSFSQLNTGDVLPYFGLLLLNANQPRGRQNPPILFSVKWKHGWKAEGKVHKQ